MRNRYETAPRKHFNDKKVKSKLFKKKLKSQR